MRVLVGCEESGVVREAFLKQGCEAYSCDLLPTRILGPHFQQDILEVIPKGWDLIILHPDCTKLAVSGNRWYGPSSERYSERLDAMNWTEALWLLAVKNAKMVALENPVGVLGQTKLGKPTQYIHPWEFGHGEVKKTGLWLHNLPKLTPTDIVEGRNPRVHNLGPTKNRKRDRSETYQGWADAMADQWTCYALDNIL